MPHLYDETITVDGIDFHVTYHADPHARIPWEDSDMHGEVIEWTPRDKYPGGRVLAFCRCQKTYYDFQASMLKAKKQGWGLSPEDLDKLTKSLGRDPTEGQILVQAVENDFQYLRGYCNDQWHCVRITVQQVNDKGEPVGESNSIWNVETFEDWHERYARIMAKDMARDYIKEQTEVEYWASRGVATVA